VHAAQQCLGALRIFCICFLELGLELIRSLASQAQSINSEFCVRILSGSIGSKLLAPR
jgi:hypothetical protein